MSNIDPVQYNREKWDGIAASSDRFFKAVTREELDAVRAGDWSINVTAQKSVPREWLEPVAGKRILCLAGAGGKQAPILAALGAEVTVFDISQRQLERDREIAEREGLAITTASGDMADLSQFESGAFDLIVNPCSVCYCPELQPIWNESFRVLVAGGSLVSGLINPVHYIFDEREKDRGNLIVRHKIPYSDLDLDEEEREKTMGKERPIDFGHSLSEMIGGVIAAGFQISGFYEDRWGGSDKLSKYIDTFFAMLATKPV